MFQIPWQESDSITNSGAVRVRKFQLKTGNDIMIFKTSTFSVHKDLKDLNKSSCLFSIETNKGIKLEGTSSMPEVENFIRTWLKPISSN